MSRNAETSSIAARVKAVLTWLESHGSHTNREGMARFGIVSAHVYGISVATLRAHAKVLGKSHALALALWETGSHEARMLAAFVDEPALVTSTQMNAWCRDFDNWALCDTVCFHLFDRSPLAYGKVESWARRRAEFEKRAGFALLASLALHDKRADDARFIPTFDLVKQAAKDERNFVKKAVSWALKGVGQRSTALHTRAVALARELAASSERTERWIGKDALRDLTEDKTLARLKRRDAATRAPRKTPGPGRPSRRAEAQKTPPRKAQTRKAQARG